MEYFKEIGIVCELKKTFSF